MGRLLALGFVIIGLGLLVISNAIYFRRTKDKPLRRFWLGKELLTRNEYLLNRGGFWLAIAGMLLRVLAWS